MEAEDLAEEKDTPTDRLAVIIARACIELNLPEDAIDKFSQDVAACVQEQEKNPLYDARRISNAIKDYAILVREEPQRNAETLVFEIYALASSTASYFLAREAALKDKALTFLIEQEERVVH